MPNNKEIKFRAVVDTQGFDQQIQQLKQKFKELQGITPRDEKADSLLSAAFGRYDKASQQEMRSMRTAMQQQQKEDRQALQEKIKLAQQLSKYENSGYTDQKERLKLLREEIDALKEKHRIQGTALNRLNQAGGGAGGGQPTGGGGLMGGQPMGWKALLSAFAVSQIASGGLNTYRYQLERERGLMSDVAQGARVPGSELAQIYQGKGYELNYWNQERQKALEMANEETQGRRFLDRGQGAMRLGIGAVAGAGAVKLGAAAGTAMAGPLGTVIGGGIGLGIGALTMDDRSRAALFDPQKYQGIALKEYMDRYQQNLNAQKVLDPAKQLGLQTFQQNIGQMTDMQLRTGMSDTDMFGGVAERAQLSEEQTQRQAGFLQNEMNKFQPSYLRYRTGKSSGMGYRKEQTAYIYPMTGEAPTLDKQGTGQLPEIFREQNLSAPDRKDYVSDPQSWIERQMGGRFSKENIMKQQQALYSAGATSEDMRGDLAQLSAQGQQLGIQNTAQILGRLSGAGTDDSGEAFKKILAEGVKRGMKLGDGGMPAEISKFARVVASIATQGGEFSEESASRISRGLVGDMNQQTIQAAAGAGEFLKNIGNRGSGFEGQMGFAFMRGGKSAELLGKEAFGKLSKDADLMNYLNQIDVAELENNPTLAKSLGKQLGLAPDKVVDYVRQLNQSKYGMFSSTDKMLESLGKDIKGKDAKGIEQFFGENEQYAKLEQRFTKERGQQFKGLNPLQRRAVIAQAALGNIEGGELPTELQDITRQLGTQKEQMGTKLEADVSKGQTQALQNMVEQFGKINESFGKTSIAATQLYEALDAVKKVLSDEEGPGFGEQINEVTEKLRFLNSEYDKEINRRNLGE